MGKITTEQQIVPCSKIKKKVCEENGVERLVRILPSNEEVRMLL